MHDKFLIHNDFTFLTIINNCSFRIFEMAGRMLFVFIGLLVLYNYCNADFEGLMSVKGPLKVKFFEKNGKL